ncbi:hypothetical protein MASR1M101_40940 [Gemmatimonas sp.]
MGRSGIALEDLLLAPDLIESREAVAPVALEVGLEAARRHLLQRQPAESLEALNAVWARAVDSEEGWYLRSGALTLLGHPGEGERLAGEALESQPQSVALRLLQSVARAVAGDLAGARAALYPALDQAPHDPVLMAQQAVVLARQGHRDDASDIIAHLATQVPDHPALGWARASVRAAVADRTRSAARPANTVGSEVFAEPERAADPAAARDPLDSAARVFAPVAEDTEGDMVASAFLRLGAELRTADDETLERATRTLLRACSAGGTLASACTPVEAHAARQVLSAMAEALRGESGAFLVSPMPLTPLVGQLLPLLRSSVRSVGVDAVPEVALADADRLLRRHSAGVPPAVREFLSLLVQGAGASRARLDVRPPASVEAMPIVTDDSELGPLVPIRLGLSLLAETTLTRALERRQEVIPGDWERAGIGETGGTGWGAARAAADVRVYGERPSRPVSAALPVLVLVAAAMGAAVNGAALAALALGAAGLWFALRRPRENG